MYDIIGVVQTVKPGFWRFSPTSTPILNRFTMIQSTDKLRNERFRPITNQNFNFFGNRFTTKKVTAFQRPSEKWEIRLWNQNNMCFGAKNVQKHDFHCPIFNSKLKAYFLICFKTSYLQYICNVQKIYFFGKINIFSWKNAWNFGYLRFLHQI